MHLEEEPSIFVSPVLKKDDGSRQYYNNIFAFIAESCPENVKTRMFTLRKQKLKGKETTIGLYSK